MTSVRDRILQDRLRQHVARLAWSDHLSFWLEGYRAMMLTDTAFFRNPHYHAATDTPTTLDYPRMAAVTEGIADTLLGISGKFHYSELLVD